MRFQTPFKFQKIAYFGVETSAGKGDELIGIGIGKLYAGIYPISTGFEVSVGILNDNGCLV